MKIGLTGTEGFIGSSVSRVLSLNGHHVVYLDSFTRVVSFEQVAINESFTNLDWVLHFGASTSINATLKTPFHTYYNNLASTLRALEIARHARAAFLFMSSYVYGQPAYLPIDEKHPVRSSNPYMGSKIIGEEICRQLSSMLRIPLIILRGFNIYGDSRTPGRLISDLLDAVQRKKEIIINDPAPKRDYLYIKDFQSLILKIVSMKPIKIGTYNVGYGKSYSNLEVAEMVRAIAGINSPVIIKGQPRQHDILNCTVDVSLVKSTFNWLPIYPLEKGLRELIE